MRMVDVTMMMQLLFWCNLVYHSTVFSRRALGFHPSFKYHAVAKRVRGPSHRSVHWAGSEPPLTQRGVRATVT